MIPEPRQYRVRERPDGSCIIELRCIEEWGVVWFWQKRINREVWVGCNRFGNPVRNIEVLLLCEYADVMTAGNAIKKFVFGDRIWKWNDRWEMVHIKSEEGR